MFGIDPTRVGEVVSAITEAFSLNPDGELFQLCVEAGELLGLDRGTLDSIVDRVLSVHPVHESGYSLFSGASSRLGSYDPVSSIPLDYCIEAYSILQSVLEDTKRNKKDGNDGSSKVENTERKVDKFKNMIGGKKEKKPGVDPITNVKLYFQGIKEKIRGLTSKEKQITNNANASFDRLARATKDALVSDKREAIIKGSVIPSFSKSCKLAVALAGIAKIASPGAALITAIGGLITSKRLTKKERALLLDEIDVELEVLEKEIQIAESRNQLKKLRKLMMIRKDLQREYQRIKLNIRVGKDVIPTADGRKKYD